MSRGSVVRWAKTAAGLFMPTPAFADKWEWTCFPGCCPEDDGGMEDCLDCIDFLYPNPIIATLAGLQSDFCSVCEWDNDDYILPGHGICVWWDRWWGSCAAQTQLDVELVFSTITRKCRFTGRYWLMDWNEKHHYESAEFAGPISAFSHVLHWTDVERSLPEQFCDGTTSTITVTAP